MSLSELFILAVALGTDAFSVAMVIGIRKFSIKEIFKLSSIIAIFHIFMPLAGLYGGHFIEELITNFFGLNGKIDYIFNLVGSGLLLLIGFYMIIEKLFLQKEEIANLQLKDLGVIILAFSVSIDAFSVGISLGMLDQIKFSVVLIFGLIAGLMMGMGLYFGSKIGHWLGDEAQIIGGIVLIYLALDFAGLL